MNVKKTCILIVDDDEGQRSLLSNYLVGEGLKVLTASTGDEALNLLESEDVSMIISDVRMPGMSGLDLLSLCRQRHPQLPVLMVTAYPDIRDAVGAVKDGAIDYLQKPIVFKDVFEYIRKNLKIGAFAAPYDEFTELPEGVIAVSPQMREVFREAAFVAASDSRILITGESGSG